jgi:hypothetical protein
MTQCGTCGQPVTDGFICTGCTGALQLDLQKLGGYRHPDGRWIPGLLADLLTTATHGAVIPSQSGGSDDEWGHTLDHRYPVVISEARTPANSAALDLHDEIRTDLIGWCTDLLATEVHSSLLAARANHQPCSYLEHRITSIRLRVWAPAMQADLARHVTAAQNLIDLPPALTVPCPTCSARVEIDQTKTIIECRCKQWGTLEWWIEQVAPPLPEPMTLREIPDWLRTRGYETTYEQLRTWSDRGLLRCTPDSGGQGRERRFAARVVLEAVEADPKVKRVIPSVMTR